MLNVFSGFGHQNYKPSCIGIHVGILNHIFFDSIIASCVNC